MAKRGPKRKRGRRFSCGKFDSRPAHIAPTAERVAKLVARFVIAGVKPDEKIDLRLASSWLGVLYAAGIITQEQYDAGNHYHDLYRLNYPQGFPKSSIDPDSPQIANTSFQPFENVSLSDDAALSLKTANKAIKAISRKGLNLVVNICGFDRFEQFIDTSSPRPMEAWKADAENKTIFLAMLDALADMFGFRVQARKAA